MTHKQKEVRLQKIPEADIIFAAGSHQTEENVRSLRAGETPMAVSDFSLDIFSCIRLAGIIVDRLPGRGGF